MSPRSRRSRVPRQSGNSVQPQNCLPAFRPVFAVRSFIGAWHEGQQGGPDIEGGSVCTSVLVSPERIASSTFASRWRALRVPRRPSSAFSMASVRWSFRACPNRFSSSAIDLSPKGRSVSLMVSIGSKAEKVRLLRRYPIWQNKNTGPLFRRLDVHDAAPQKLVHTPGSSHSPPAPP